MMKVNLSRFSLKLIFLFLVVILVLTTSFTIFYYYNTTNLLKIQLTTTNNYTLKQINSNIKYTLNDFETASYNLMISPEIQSLSSEENMQTNNDNNSYNNFSQTTQIEGVLYNIAASFSGSISQVFIYSKNGQVYGSGLTSSSPIELSYNDLLSKCNSANKDFESGKLVFIYDNKTKTLSSFKYLYNIYSLKVIGIIEIRPQVNFLKDIINSPLLSPAYNVLLYDNIGNIIYKKKQ